MKRWPRPARIAVKLGVSLAILVGYPFLAGNIAWTAYDIVTLEGCVTTYGQIVADYKIAYDHTPDTADVQAAAAYYAETEHVLESRTESLACPHSTQDEQARFIAANRKFSALMDGIAKDGPSGEAMFLLKLYGNDALTRQHEFEAALLAETQSQHPQ